MREDSVESKLSPGRHTGTSCTPRGSYVWFNWISQGRPTMRNRILLSLAVTVFGVTSLSAQDRGPAVNKPTLKEGKPGLVAEATITPDSALALAQAKVPTGALIEQEIDYTKGRLMYNFEFKVPGKPGTDEVNVDAKYGTVSDVDH